jgi:isocitrate dehydrogenase (NAD+)
MTTHGPQRITVIEGDGIGPEVIGAARRVVEATGVPVVWDPQLAGAKALERFANPIPDQLIRSIRRNRVALKGPLETRVGREGFRSVNVALRKTFDLYANLRPVSNLPGIKTAFSGVDLVVVRENTEDVYSGIEHQIAPGVVEAVKVITAKASRRIARFAFEYALRHGRSRVTAIHKANIMKLSDGLFLASARQLAKRYPRVRYDELIVDNACMQLVLRPGTFDILLLENLYGDIVSDLCAGLVGGLGVVPGANLGDRIAIFEAVHGVAPDIMGKDVANPIAAILSAALMLDHLGAARAARRVRAAVHAVVSKGKTLTRDLGGRATTTQFTDALCREIDAAN